MVSRKTILATNEFYHIFNKTVADELIFNNKKNLNRALALVNFYRFKTSISFSHFQSRGEDEKKELWKVISSTPPLIELYCFSFMPNHYHFLLRQMQDDGIDSFICNFQNSFAKYFNIKFNRKGSLFCHSFERVLIETEEQFIHVSRYIHLNPVTSYIIKLEELDNYPFTSFPVYLGNKN
ncbi:MAG: transposase, partial [Microgenomates group bacterium]